MIEVFIIVCVVSGVFLLRNLKIGSRSISNQIGGIQGSLKRGRKQRMFKQDTRFPRKPKPKRRRRYY
jgi:hypothetical protein